MHYKQHMFVRVRVTPQGEGAASGGGAGAARFGGAAAEASAAEL